MRGTKVLDSSRDVPLKLLTPLMRQYLQLKRRYPDAILLFRVGDFYETYFEDAKVFSEVADIVLTRRPLPNGYEIPMAGVPYHSVDNYVKLLIESGYKVAVAEQLEDPKKAKGLVKRDVVQVITSGTVINPEYLRGEIFNFLGALTYNTKGLHLLLVDFSSRRAFYTWSPTSRELLNLLESYSPKEVIYKPSRVTEELIAKLREGVKLSVTARNSTALPKDLREYIEQPDALYKVEQYGGEETLRLAIAYLIELNPGIDVKLSLEVQEPHEYVRVDPSTLRNLEVFRGPEGGERGSLIWALDRCVTPMGSRMLRLWLLKPLRDLRELSKRQSVVEALVRDELTLHSLREELRGIGDLDRLASKVRYRRASLSDMYSLLSSLKSAERLTASRDVDDRLRDKFDRITAIISELKPLIEELEAALELDESGAVTFRRGYDVELDEYRDLIEGGQRWLEEYQELERRRTGIKSLKIGYNQVFGYYIEVTKANLHLVPSDYERKQTLTSAERFITKELREFEARYLRAQEGYSQRLSELTYLLYDKVDSGLALIDSLSSMIAEIDVLSTFAILALERNYVKPELRAEKLLHLKAARHPVMELIREDFVPNSLELTAERNFMILTGPNMGGKSTYLKTIGLITLMAHIGSFVPADEAVVGLTDAIYSRMGASDDILRGRSTFMVEMLEVANILDSATEESLILLDEVGRGTSTYDGLALAWAITEYLAKRIRARVIFATHFYQLTTLEGKLPGVFNCHVEVSDEDGKLTFLYEVKEGALLKSYGVEVAKLAGLREEVVRRAYQLLKELEITQIPRSLQLGLFSVSTARESRAFKLRRRASDNLPSEVRSVLDELRRLNPDELRPIDALSLIYRWKERLRGHESSL